MANLFKITYFNGLSDFVRMELENIEHVAGQIFGKAVAELQSFGGNVELVPEEAVVPPVVEAPAPAPAPVEPAVPPVEEVPAAPPAPWAPAAPEEVPAPDPAPAEAPAETPPEQAPPAV